VEAPRDNVTVLAVRESHRTDAVAARLGWRQRWFAPIDPPLAFMTFLSGVVLIGAARAIEPLPAHPNAGVPLWLLAIDTVVWGGVCVGGIGLVKFRRVGLLGAAVAAAALVVESAACVISGHHRFGVWWLGQIACTSAFAGAVAVAARISARSQSSAA
jgi:hypothetical protein